MTALRKTDQLPARQLVISNLACERGHREIFTNLNFSAGPGEIVLLRGANGVGKTSALMCLAGFLPVASGSIEHHGHDKEQRPDQDIHFVGHLSALKPGLSVVENLVFWAHMLGGDPAYAPDILAAAGLAHAANLDASLLSAGQSRRLALARLNIAPRPLWLLDEPTAALDKAGDQWVASLIETHLDSGGLAVVATHLDLALGKTDRVKTCQLGAK